MYKRQFLFIAPVLFGLHAVLAATMSTLMYMFGVVGLSLIHISIPTSMKHAVTAGIGKFIAFVGFSGAGLVVANESTKVSMGHFTPTVVIAAIGLFIIGVLDKKGVKGSILYGIVVSSILAWIFSIIDPEAAAKLGISLPKDVYKRQIKMYMKYRLKHG